MTRKWKLLLALGISLPLAAQLGGPNENQFAYVDDGAGGFTIWNAVTTATTPPYPMRGINLWCQNGGTIGHCNPSSGPGSMVYPAAGIGNSTGTAWDTSYSAAHPIPANFLTLPTATNTVLGVASGDNASLSVTSGAFSINLAHVNNYTVQQNFVGGIGFVSAQAFPVLSWNGTANAPVLNNGGAQVELTNSNKLAMIPGGVYAWLSGAVGTGGDTGFSRAGAAEVALGNSANGDKTGKLDFQQANYTPVTITASATPAIGTASLQIITLSANATPTVTIASGEQLTLTICQPASGGPFTWAPPASMHNAISSASIAAMPAGTCAVQDFASYNGTTLMARNTGAVNVAP